MPSPTSCDGDRAIDSRYRKKQYKDQFKRWNFEKNIKTDEMKAIIRIRKRRWDDEDKDTQFRLHQNLFWHQNFADTRTFSGHQNNPDTQIFLTFRFS